MQRLSPIHLIIGEAQNVVSMMRLNARWAYSGSVYSESSLLNGFKALRSLLDDKKYLSEIEATQYLKPFLSVIRSEETSGLITSQALSSVHKFLKMNLIDEKAPQAEKAMSNLAEAVIHCRFEATDPENDEIVLFKILNVLLEVIRCPAGILLRDELVYEIIQSCFRMSIQSRSSPLLRKTAETTLSEIIHVLFSNFLHNPERFSYITTPTHNTNPTATHNETHSGVKTTHSSPASLTSPPPQPNSPTLPYSALKPCLLYTSPSPRD
eukprot:TRINITY_DN5400_c0_g1_i1.p1 TRINITY_DN5400_c0_g1~~TRINITY_DN5400_c0_g1_i1.p1  ORF type:complete len:267 (+),score=47.53 TRINITY_DN5400_c0_g1_i1:219-1019(+)